jgi:hypothetical protein
VVVAGHEVEDVFSISTGNLPSVAAGE